MGKEDFDFSHYYCWQDFSKWPEEVGGGREPSFWVQGFGRLYLVWIFLLRFKVLQRGCGHDLKLGEWKYQTPKMVLCTVFSTTHAWFSTVHPACELETLFVWSRGHSYSCWKKIEMAFFKFIVPSWCCQLGGSITHSFI